MFKEERQFKIIEYMTEKANKNQGVKTNDLIEKFDVSSSTMRRDLDDLENSGLIKRIHGGAILKKSLNSQYDFVIKQEENIDLKRNIAKYAASLIEDGDIIAINSSTLTYLIIEYIEAKDVKIVTNSIEAINLISKNSTIDIIVLGGVYIPKAKTIEGSITVEQIKKMHFDKAFLGANGIDIKMGITTAGPIEVGSKEAMIESSDKAYFLCESNKFGKNSFYKIADLNGANGIITDRFLLKDVYEKYTKYVDIYLV